MDYNNKMLKEKYFRKNGHDFKREAELTIIKRIKIINKKRKKQNKNKCKRQRLNKKQNKIKEKQQNAGR